MGYLFIAVTCEACHTHSVLTAILPGAPGIAGCPLILLLHLFQDCTSFWDRPKLSMSFLTQSHQVLFERPFYVIPSTWTSHIIQRLTFLACFASTYRNHLKKKTTWTQWLITSIIIIIINIIIVKRFCYMSMAPHEITSSKIVYYYSALSSPRPSIPRGSVSK